MLDHRSRLLVKLCVELAGAEREARIYSRREARRLGEAAPARALLAIADHAEGVEAAIERLIEPRRGTGHRLVRAFARVMARVRGFVLDRWIDRERSYRATLLRLKHGVDTLRLLREVAAIGGDVKHVQFCDLVLVERLCLLEDAELAMVWFAEQPELALGASSRLVLPAAAAAVMAQAGS